VDLLFNLWKENSDLSRCLLCFILLLFYDSSVQIFMKGMKLFVHRFCLSISKFSVIGPS